MYRENWLPPTLLMFLVGHIQIHSKEVIIKYVKLKSETIRLSCPQGHVIFNPQLLGGAFTTPSSTNCTGISPKIRDRTDKCHFRKICEIELENSDTVLCNEGVYSIDYVEIGQPYCIPRDIIIDIGTNRTIRYSKPHGIIRSHRYFPLLSRNIPRKSTIRIPIPKSYTLFITYNAGRGRRLRDVAVFKRVGSNFTQIRLRPNKVSKVQYLGHGVKELVVKTTLRKGKQSRGFVIPFALYSNKSLKHLYSWPKEARPVMRDIGWIFEVKAVIEQCTVESPGQMSLACPKDTVIYSPALGESGYKRLEPKCSWGRYPCGGFSPGILVQKNTCYWKNRCNITWTGPRPILVSRKPKCIGYQASTIGFSGHRCVNKNSIYDLCDQNDTDVIISKWGIIRSHPSYPWYFDSKFAVCKRIIKIGKRVLHLLIQDINLDPDGKDKIWIRHNGRVILDTKTTIEGVEKEVQGGTLVIKFKPYKKSKAGRGFIILFRKYSAKTYQNQRTVGTDRYQSDVIQDEGQTGRIRLSNRRLCSGTKKYRQKGRACAPRVWTDYFTRLE